MRLCAISHAKGVRVRQLNIRVAISNVNSHTLADWCILQQRFVSWVHLQILPTFVHCCVNELNRHTKILPNVNFTLVCLQAIDIQPLTLGKMAMQRTIIPSRESCVGNQQTDLSPRTATLDKQYSKTQRQVFVFTTTCRTLDTHAKNFGTAGMSGSVFLNVR